MERLEDGGNMNAVSAMFHAGISNKFTKRHVSNFHDTTLSAASAAKKRAELKLERQADAIEKQQQKIETEVTSQFSPPLAMKKIEGITQNLHRQQLREAKRLRNRLNYAAAKIQAVYRSHLACIKEEERVAAAQIQRLSRGFLARRFCLTLRLQHLELVRNRSATIISHSFRGYISIKVRARDMEVSFRAACVIQSVVRMAAAKTLVQELRQLRHEAERRHRAAIVVQSNARSFMTRLIYLDVLYLICRIQAAMRGCLVRKQLRWIRPTDMEAISRLQAHVRGFLVRRRMEEFQREACNVAVDASMSATSTEEGALRYEEQEINADNLRTWEQKVLAVGEPRQLEIRVTRAATIASGIDSNLQKKALDRPLGRSSTGLGWQPSAEPVIKRSYWLPAGASFDRRLPVLPVPKRMMALEAGDTTDGEKSNDSDELWPMVPSRTPKKRPHQKPCPARLSPVIIPSARTGAYALHSASESEPEDDRHDALGIEERARRAEELKLKLLSRKNQEIRKQEQELKLKREAENEANERKVMEREEKSTRLQLKILRRRSKEGKIRKLSVDQRLEERERLAMAREERLMRLHLKLCGRQQLKKRQQLAAASSTKSDGKLEPPSSASSRRKTSTTEAPKKTSSSKDGEAVDSEDDGDMSFLDIDFAIPSAMQPRQKVSNSRVKAQHTKSRTQKVKTRRKRPADGKNNQQDLESRTPGLVKETGTTEQTADDLEDLDNCDYGNEFEDMVDEAALGVLIC